MPSNVTHPVAVVARTAGSSKYRLYAVGVLSLIALLNAMDQSILSAMFPAIQAEFGLSDTQVGFIASAYVVVYAIAVLPLGYLADRVSRRGIIGVGVGLWSLVTLLTGLTRSFPQMIAARAFLGIGESSWLPAGMSLLGDYFPKSTRGRATGLVQAGFQLGIAFGIIAGGAIAMQLGWRAAFYLAAAPGLLLAGLAFTLREPLRGAAEERGPRVARPVDAGLSAFRRLLGIRSFLAGVLSVTFTLFVLAGTFQFVNIYLHREFGVDLAVAGALVGVPLLLAGLVGNPLGGWLVDWRSRWSPRAHLEIPCILTSIMAVGMVAVFSARSPAAFEAAFLIVVIPGGMIQPAFLALNQNVVVPSLRASATALQTMVSNLLGFALGPIILGAASDQLHDLRLAFLLLAPVGLVLAALCAAAGLGSMRRDVQVAEDEWARRSDPDVAPAV